jgi:signal transduction histidine kinase
MRYRADLIHGKLIVDSRPGGGTTVRCEVPVDSDSPD